MHSKLRRPQMQTVTPPQAIQPTQARLPTDSRTNFDDWAALFTFLATLFGLAPARGEERPPAHRQSSFPALNTERTSATRPTHLSPLTMAIRVSVSAPPLSTFFFGGMMPCRALQRPRAHARRPEAAAFSRPVGRVPARLFPLRTWHDQPFLRSVQSAGDITPRAQRREERTDEPGSARQDLGMSLASQTSDHKRDEVDSRRNSRRYIRVSDPFLWPKLGAECRRMRQSPAANLFFAQA